MIVNNSFTPDKLIVGDFPKLMADLEHHLVVLFHAPGKGMVVLAPDNQSRYPVGHYSEGWVMDRFAFYRRGVTLHNA